MRRAPSSYADTPPHNRPRWHAADVGLLAHALGLGPFAVLGHSYGLFVALQHAVDFPGQAAQTIMSSGVPASRFLMSHGPPPRPREIHAS